MLTRAIVSGTACAYCGRFLATLRSKNHASCPHHADSWHKPPPRRNEKGKESHASSDHHRKGTQTKAANQTGGETITEKPSGPEPCYQKFCNRVCATKSADTYGPLVCPQRNPQYHQVLRQADQEEFRAPHIVFKLYAAMLMANERGDPVASDAANDDAATRAHPTTPPLETESKPAAAVNGHPPSPDAAPAEAANAPNGAPASPAAKKAKKSKGKKKSTSGPPETQAPTAEMREIIERVSGLAVVSERARRERSAVSQFGGMSTVADIRFGNVWKSSWHIVLKALHINTGYRKPAAKAGAKDDGEDAAAELTREEEEEATDRFWEAFWKRRLPAKLIADLFGVEKYLLMLGMVSLNQECDNGLFLLHARLNRPFPVTFFAPAADECGQTRATRIAPSRSRSPTTGQKSHRRPSTS